VTIFKPIGIRYKSSVQLMGLFIFSVLLREYDFEIFVHHQRSTIFQPKSTLRSGKRPISIIG
jgi:hypothetical protein